MCLDWPNLVIGAVLGAIASIAFACIGKLLQLIWNRFPLRALLGELADNKKELSIFLRDMKSKDGNYYSLADAGCREPPWHNITSVVGRYDVEPATDILNLLGQAGRTLNIAWRQIDRDGDLWDQPLICVGGSSKANRCIELCEPQIVRYDNGVFETLDDNQPFRCDQTNDFAVIYRGLHPGTGVSCFVVFGFGEAGTRTAGNYLRKHARDLGKLYFSRPFAAIIRVRWTDGKESGTVVWLSPSTSWGAFLFWRTFGRYRKFIARRVKSSQPRP